MVRAAKVWVDPAGSPPTAVTLGVPAAPGSPDAVIAPFSQVNEPAGPATRRISKWTAEPAPEGVGSVGAVQASRTLPASVGVPLRSVTGSGGSLSATVPSSTCNHP